MAEYTPEPYDDGWPNDDAVRVMFVGTSIPLSYDEKRRAALYDRWLAAHDREVRQGMLPDGARFFPDEAGIVYGGKVYFPGDYVLTRLDIAPVRAAALREAAEAFAWAGDDEGYTAFRDWLTDRADRIQEGDA